MKEINKKLIGAEPFKDTIDKIISAKESNVSLTLPNFIFLMDEGEGFKTLSNALFDVFSFTYVGHNPNHIYESNGHTICYIDDINFSEELNTRMQNEAVYTNDYHGMISVDINEFPLTGSINTIKFLQLIASSGNNVNFTFRLGRDKVNKINEYLSCFNTCGNIEIIKMDRLSSDDFNKYVDMYFINKSLVVEFKEKQKITSIIHKLSEDELLSGYIGAERLLNDLVYYLSMSSPCFLKNRIVTTKDIASFKEDVVSIKYMNNKKQPIGFLIE